MIDLTPLDVRNKRGDFRKGMRGYDPQEVDHFLELVAERLDEVVKENLTLNERVTRLAEQLSGQQGREKAVQEALVTAQALREEIREQAHRDAELTRREAEDDAERIRDAAERAIEGRRHELDDLNRSRGRFLRTFRTLLERELDVVRVEEERPILEDLDLDALQVFHTRDRADARGEGPPADDGSDEAGGPSEADDPGEADVSGEAATPSESDTSGGSDVPPEPWSDDEGVLDDSAADREQERARRVEVDLSDREEPR